MPRMPSTRQVIMGAGWSLMLALAGVSTQADPWYREQGLASYYGKGFHGRTAADGDRFSQHEMTAAHRQLPLGTKVMVENRTTGEQVEVKITDGVPMLTPNAASSISPKPRHTVLVLWSQASARCVWS